MRHKQLNFSEVNRLCLFRTFAHRIKAKLVALGAQPPPTQCLLCRSMQRSEHRNICAPCFDSLERHQPCCPKCATPLPESFYASQPKSTQQPNTQTVCGKCINSKSAINQIWIASPYRPPISYWLRGVKDRRQLIYLPPLNALLAEKLERLDTSEIDLLIPIPIHWTRRLRRGYNQAELLAQSLGRTMEIPVSTASLKRISAVKSQRGLGKKQRIRNQQKGFAVNKPNSLLGKNVLLIDDIYTTGATGEAAAKAIRKAGASSVRLAAIARTPHPRDHNFTN